jgi:hypothetical protein
MRSIRWRFDRGIRLVGRPSEGEARFIQDALVEHGRLRPIALPNHNTQEDVTGGVTCIWKRRNMRRVSVRRRHYGICAVPGQEILCYTEDGTYPQKEISGRVYPLGIPQPRFAIQKSPESYEARYSLTVKTGGRYNYSTTIYYCFVMKGPMGYMPATEAVAVVFPDGSDTPSAAAGARERKPWLFTKSDEQYDLKYDDSAKESGGKDDLLGRFKVEIVLPRPIGFKGYTGCMVFCGSTAENLNLIYEATPDESIFTDNGMSDTGKSLASIVGTGTKEAIYTHAYVFRDGGYESEGAPAAISESLKLGSGTILTFDPDLDGYWEQSGRQTIQVALTGSVLGPATMGEATQPVAVSLGAAFDDQGSFGLNCALAAPVDHPDGLGLATYMGANIGCPQIAKPYRTTVAGVKGSHQASKINFPELHGKVIDLVGFNKVRSISGGTVASWRHDEHYGGIRVNLGDHGLTTGERVLLYLDPGASKDSPSKKGVYEFMRDVSNPGFGWLVGDTPWDWKTDEVIRWARNLLFLPINNTGRSVTVQSLIEPGTFVRLTHERFGTLTALAFPSASGLYLQGDWSELEYLGLLLPTVNVITTPITLDFYARNAGIVGRRIFRQDSGEFLMVEEIPIWQTRYSDCRPVASLGNALTGEYLDESGSPVLTTPPPSDLTGLIQHENLLAGLSGGVVRLSVPGRPDAWPENYYFKPDDIPVGLASYGGSIIVGCRNSISRIDGGPSPATMRITRTLCEDGLLAAHSFQGTPHGLVFLGTRGICITNGHESRCISDDKVKIWNLFSRRQVSDLGEALAGFTVGEHAFDTLKGAQASWVAAAEDATAIGALTIDGVLGIPRVDNAVDWDGIGSAYHRGRYFLYQRSNAGSEGCGSWMVDLSSNPSQMLHLGFSPLDTWVDGNDFWLLLNGDQ